MTYTLVQTAHRSLFLRVHARSADNRQKPLDAAAAAVAAAMAAKCQKSWVLIGIQLIKLVADALFISVFIARTSDVAIISVDFSFFILTHESKNI